MMAPIQNAPGTVSAEPSTSSEEEARRAVAAVIETYRLAFLHLDLDQLASVWDCEHEPLVYVAQEKAEPILGWAAIKSYLAALPEHLDEVSAKVLDDVQIDVLGETAIAFFTSRSSVKLKGHPTMKYEPIGHVSMIFRRTPQRPQTPRVWVSAGRSARGRSRCGRGTHGQEKASSASRTLMGTTSGHRGAGSAPSR